MRQENQGWDWVAVIVMMIAVLIFLLSLITSIPEVQRVNAGQTLPAEALPGQHSHHTTSKLVSDRILDAQGKPIYCVHWEPCEVCRLSCVR